MLMPAKEELYEEGMLDFSMGEFDAAIAKFRQALDADPRYVDALHAMAEAHSRKGDVDTAIEIGKKVLELQPDQLAHTSMSRFYVKKGMKAEAEHHGAQARMAGWREDLKAAQAAGKPAPPPPQPEKH